MSEAKTDPSQIIMMGIFYQDKPDDYYVTVILGSYRYVDVRQTYTKDSIGPELDKRLRDINLKPLPHVRDKKQLKAIENKRLNGAKALEQ